MRSKSKARRAAMAALVAAGLVMGVGQANAYVRRFPVDSARGPQADASQRIVERQVRGATGLVGSLRFIFIQYWILDGQGAGYRGISTQRMPVTRAPLDN